MRSRSFETHSLPSSLATTHRGFAFYVAFPKSSIRPLGLTHLCRSHPCGSIETRSLPALARCFPRSFTFYVADPVSSIRRGEPGATPKAFGAETRTRLKRAFSACSVVNFNPWGDTPGSRRIRPLADKMTKRLWRSTQTKLLRPSKLICSQKEKSSSNHA